MNGRHAVLTFMAVAGVALAGLVGYGVRKNYAQEAREKREKIAAEEGAQRIKDRWRADADEEARKPRLPPRAPTLSEALLRYKPATRVGSEADQGTERFITWATAFMIWPEAAPEGKAETKPSAIFKDPQAEQGKRGCYPGQVAKIERADFGQARPFVGQLVTPSGDVVSFVAVRSTGNIVKNSTATFCGAALGVHSYMNMTGAFTDAIFVVGMFDLLENRTWMAR